MFLVCFSAEDAVANEPANINSLPPIVEEGIISRNLPENFIAISWQEIADSYLCSSGQSQDIIDALKTFEPDSTWFVYLREQADVRRCCPAREMGRKRLEHACSACTYV